MSTHPQLEFPFASLDFPGRSTLYAWEIAQRLGCTVQHILNLIDEGELVAVDLRGRTVSRRTLRIPVEAYRDFIAGRLTGPARREFLARLPRATLVALRAELEALLAA